jgi:GT2 family glycosyltransferase
MSDSLVVIPTFVRSEKDLEITKTTLRTLRAQEPDVDVMVVDDGSPEPGLVSELGAFCENRDHGINAVFHAKPENEGFSRTVNVGIRSAVATNKHVILCNADMEFNNSFVRVLETTEKRDGSLADVSGALLLYDSGLIAHAGIFFSFLNRSFDHRYRFGPGSLPEAHLRSVCPVTGALQFIRSGTLSTVGLYDEEFRMGFEDVDYCLRVFDAGLECVYDPRAIAIHHESMFRGQGSETLTEWQQASLELLHSKHGKTRLGQFVPALT